MKDDIALLLLKRSELLIWHTNGSNTRGTFFALISIRVFLVIQHELQHEVGISIQLLFSCC